MGTAATGAARDRIRCIHLPMLDKLHYALHMYLDLAGKLKP